MERCVEKRKSFVLRDLIGRLTTFTHSARREGIKTRFEGGTTIRGPSSPRNGLRPVQPDRREHKTRVGKENKIASDFHVVKETL